MLAHIASMVQKHDRFDFVMRFSKTGFHWRWRLFSFGTQVNTGEARTQAEARESARKAKETFRKENKGKSGPPKGVGTPWACWKMAPVNVMDELGRV